MLQLKKLGIDDLVHFDFMDPPGAVSMYHIFFFDRDELINVSQVVIVVKSRLEQIPKGGPLSFPSQQGFLRHR